MTWDDIQNHWPELKKALSKDHPDLEFENLETTPEGRRQLLQLLEAKYGAAEPIAENDVEELINEGGKK